ncbi:hypothetical protein [Luteolibacter sp. AS25]|uniref:hypothetical protein n=1 Tax=Luteolibacter sp. AS25 TaxID=3135776 RepID=UPI00398B73ED
MSHEKPYTRAELESRPDTFPDRGPLCLGCNTRIPEFAELTESEATRIRELIAEDEKAFAMSELESATGCSTRFAKIWVIHSGIPDLVGDTAPCPYCGGDLITAKAQQCQHCYMDWHDPKRPYNLRTKKPNKSEEPTPNPPFD